MHNNTIFRALRHRNYRLFFIGQGISLIGTWMQQIAMSWLVYRMTGSPLVLGLVGFFTQAPTFFLSPIAGVIADRRNRHKILLVAQILAMIQASVLAFLTMRGIVNVWHIIVLGAVLGCVNALEIPVRHSFVLDMVERRDSLGNAIALNSLMFNAARLIGPAIAGFIIATLGEGVCFFINAVSFLAVIFSLGMMKMKPRPLVIRPPVLDGLIEGVRYTFGSPPIISILMLLAFISMIGASYVILLPVFAKHLPGGGPRTLGFLMSAIGAGALIGTFFLASCEKTVKLGRILPLSSSLFGIALILVSLSASLPLSMMLLAVAGFGFMVHMASCNTILQTIVEDDKRGRVMSFYTMAFMGMAPIGSFLGGAAARYIGAPNTLILGGIACLIVSAIFASKISFLKKHAYPAYEMRSNLT